MTPDDDKTLAITVLTKGTVINHYRIIEKIGASKEFQETAIGPRRQHG